MEPFVFTCVYGQGRLTITPADVDKKRGVNEPGKRAEFYNHELRTRDIEVIEYLRGHDWYAAGKIGEPQEQMDLDPREAFGRTPEEPEVFKCDECDAEFEREVQLRGHVLSHARKNAKKSA